MRNVAFVAEQLAEKALGQLGRRDPVIHIAGREVISKQLTLEIDHQMGLRP